MRTPWLQSGVPFGLSARLGRDLGLVLVALLAGAAVACGSSLPPPSATPAADPATDAKLRQSLAGPQRTDAEKARDVYRHPLETLEFFGMRDSMTVVEIEPGGGWYTAVLAPVLRERGKLSVAEGDPNGNPKSEGTKNAQALQTRMQATPAAFDQVRPSSSRAASPCRSARPSRRTWW